MRTVSVSELKAKLSAYLAIVRAGDEVVVTDRGRMIARLVPGHVGQRHDSRRDELLESGRMRAPWARLPKDFWERPRPKDPEGRSLAVLLEERDEGR
jgi:prevent-host-death family protein